MLARDVDGMGRNTANAYRALGLRRASGQHFGEHLAVDVAAAQDEAHAFAGHAVMLPQQSGQRRRAGALGNIVGILEAGAHGLGDLVLGARARRAPHPVG